MAKDRISNTKLFDMFGGRMTKSMDREAEATDIMAFINITLACCDLATRIRAVPWIVDWRFSESASVIYFQIKTSQQWVNIAELNNG